MQRPMSDAAGPRGALPLEPWFWTRWPRVGVLQGTVLFIRPVATSPIDGGYDGVTSCMRQWPPFQLHSPVRQYAGRTY
jgi:hypothetical protein